MEAHYYNVDLLWSKERKGILSSVQLNSTIEVATPPPFAMGVEGIWSPEHLLTASMISCFMTTFLAIAENSKLAFTSLKCEANGKLDQIEGKYLMTEILLKPTLEILNEKDKDKAIRILHKSESACLISNSIKSKVILEPTVNLSS